jgi:ethanolamine permease
MKVVVGENSGWLHMLVWIGLFGLIASFHGIIMGYSRQIFALARAGYLPAYFAGAEPALQHAAPRAAGRRRDRHRGHLQRRMGEFGGQTLTANIVTMAVLGAIVMYLISMAALFKLRKSEPNLAHLPRALLPRVPGHRARPRRRLPGRDGLVQLHADACCSWC